MQTISIEIRCDSKDQADSLTEKVMNGNHHVGRKHGAWFWFCECPANEILHLGQELHYELDAAAPGVKPGGETTAERLGGVTT